MNDFFEVLDGSYLVRTSATGDKIYLIQDGSRYWIKNPETLEKLGFRFGQEKEITYTELIDLEDGGYIDMKPRKIEMGNDVSDKKPILNYRRSA